MVVGFGLWKMVGSYILEYNAVTAMEKLHNKNTIIAKRQTHQQPQLVPA